MPQQQLLQAQQQQQQHYHIQQLQASGGGGLDHVPREFFAQTSLRRGLMELEDALMAIPSAQVGVQGKAGAGHCPGVKAVKVEVVIAMLRRGLMELEDTLMAIPPAQMGAGRSWPSLRLFFPAFLRASPSKLRMACPTFDACMPLSHFPCFACTCPPPAQLKATATNDIRGRSPFLLLLLMPDFSHFPSCSCRPADTVDIRHGSFHVALLPFFPHAAPSKPCMSRCTFHALHAPRQLMGRSLCSLLIRMPRS